MAWNETSWHFVTSQGGEITYGAIGATGGSFFLENKYSHKRIELVYGAVGVGVLAGIPFSISGATRDMHSRGVGAILARNRPRLFPEDFAGFFVMGNLQFSVISHGATLSAIFFNIPPLDMLISSTGIGMTADLLVGATSGVNPLLDSAKAMGMIWAASVGLDVSAGGMYYYGYLDLA